LQFQGKVRSRRGGEGIVTQRRLKEDMELKNQKKTNLGGVKERKGKGLKGGRHERKTIHFPRAKRGSKFKCMN